MGIKVKVGEKSMSMLSVTELRVFAAEKGKRSGKARTELVKRKASLTA